MQDLLTCSFWDFLGSRLRREDGMEFCGWLIGEAGFRFVVSVRPVGLRNYLTYFPCTQHAVRRACARARTVPGTPVGRMPVRSQVFERRLPPGPVAIFTDGVGRRSEILPFWRCE